MNPQSIETYFLKISDEDKNMSNGIAAIKTLLMVLEKTNCEVSPYSRFFRNFHDLICSHNNPGDGKVD